MNTSEQTDSPKCPKYDIKHRYISEFQTKEATIMDKSPTDIGLVKRVKLSSGKKKLSLQNKLKKTDEPIAQIAAINKEISNLKAEIVTKINFF